MKEKAIAALKAAAFLLGVILIIGSVGGVETGRLGVLGGIGFSALGAGILGLLAYLEIHKE